MSEGTTYLELSQEGGGAHKFYEVTARGTVVSVRYGRIGAGGQQQTSTFPTGEKARAAAARKIGEKVRKGYAPAVQGQRSARPVTRRQVTSTPSTARAVAPVLWRFRTGASAFGIHVAEDRCWVGNQHGDVDTLGHDGEVLARYQLPDGVKCLVADDFWIYAGCDDGMVYDLSSKVPFAAYDIAPDVDIFWLDIREGVLHVADRDGGLTVIDHEDEFQWSRRSAGAHAWMVRRDERAVYHGHHRGVTAYRADGSRELWHTPTNGAVLFGWQEDHAVYAGTDRRVVQRLAKDDGALEATYRCDTVVYSCATAPGGRYVFAGDSASSVYCFAADGTRLWKLGTRRRIGPVDAVSGREAVPGHHPRVPGVCGRERRRRHRRPVGHRAPRPGCEVGRRAADIHPVGLGADGGRGRRLGDRGGVRAGGRPAAGPCRLRRS